MDSFDVQEEPACPESAKKAVQAKSMPEGRGGFLLEGSQTLRPRLSGGSRSLGRPATAKKPLVKNDSMAHNSEKELSIPDTHGQ